MRGNVPTILVSVVRYGVGVHLWYGKSMRFGDLQLTILLDI